MYIMFWPCCSAGFAACVLLLRGSSSVLFAYSFLLLFGQIDNIYKVEQDSLYFFFLRGIQGHLFKRKKFYPFVCGFRDMNF